jgi:hypothetical protein
VTKKKGQLTMSPLKRVKTFIKTIYNKETIKTFISGMYDKDITIETYTSRVVSEWCHNL